MFVIKKKLIIIKKICNDNDNDNENDRFVMIMIMIMKMTVWVVLVLRLTGQILLYIFFLWKNYKHLKHKQKHFK